MPSLTSTLQKAIQTNEENIHALSQTIEKMTTTLDRLTDAIRPRIAPIHDDPRRIAPEAARNHISGQTAREAQNPGDIESHVGVISEFDMSDGTCLISLKNEGDRIPAIVLDLRFGLPNNPYVESMAAIYALPMLARIERNENGVATKVFIVGTPECGLDSAWR